MRTETPGKFHDQGDILRSDRRGSPFGGCQCQIVVGVLSDFTAVLDMLEFVVRPHHEDSAAQAAIEGSPWISTP